MSTINALLIKAREEVAAYGRIKMDTAAQLMACGMIVEKLEYRLLNELEKAA